MPRLCRRRILSSPYGHFRRRSVLLARIPSPDFTFHISTELPVFPVFRRSTASFRYQRASSPARRQAIFPVRSAALCPLAMRHDSRGRQETTARKTAPFLPPAWPACNYCTLRFCRLLTSGRRRSCKRVDHHAGDDVRRKKHALLPATFLRKAKLRPKESLAASEGSPRSPYPPSPLRSFKQDY